MSRIRIERSQRRLRLAAGALLALFVLLALLVVPWPGDDRPATNAPESAAVAATPAPAAAPAPTPRLAPPPPAMTKSAPRLPERASPFVAGLDGEPDRYTLREGGVSAFVDERGIALSLMDSERSR